MELLDHLKDVVDLLQDTPMDQLALIAVVTVVTAGVVYLLLDALRYRAIPELKVDLTPGNCVGAWRISTAARCALTVQALTAD
jgi:hypothetical protein